MNVLVAMTAILLGVSNGDRPLSQSIETDSWPGQVQSLRRAVEHLIAVPLPHNEVDERRQVFRTLDDLVWATMLFAEAVADSRDGIARFSSGDVETPDFESRLVKVGRAFREAQAGSIDFGSVGQPPFDWGLALSLHTLNIKTFMVHIDLDKLEGAMFARRDKDASPAMRRTAASVRRFVEAIRAQLRVPWSDLGGDALLVSRGKGARQAWRLFETNRSICRWLVENNELGQHLADLLVKLGDAQDVWVAFERRRLDVAQEVMRIGRRVVTTIERDLREGRVDHNDFETIADDVMGTLAGLVEARLVRANLILARGISRDLSRSLELRTDDAAVGPARAKAARDALSVLTLLDGQLAEADLVLARFDRRVAEAVGHRTPDEGNGGQP